MLHARVGVPSGIQDTTYQENRESANELANIAFMSKGELRRMIESLCLEKAKWREEKKTLTKEVVFYQRECVVLNNTIIQINSEHLKLDLVKPVMRVIRTGD